MAAKAPPLTPAHEAAIKALADSLTATVPPEDRVDPEAIATQHGLAFRYASFPEEFDGILLCENRKFLIVCNERRAPRGSPRSRFTFAHELGHYFIIEHRAALESGTIPPHFSLAEFASAQPIEREADCFAANLLMPEYAFRKFFALHAKADLNLIREAADQFGTSVTATAFRALGLDLFPAPAALFRWDPLGKMIVRRISPATVKKDWQYCGLVDAPAPGTLTAEAVANLLYGHRTRETHVMDWFAKLDGFGIRHQDEIQEEVLSLGSHGWMTLVHP